MSDVIQLPLNTVGKDLILTNSLTVPKIVMNGNIYTSLSGGSATSGSVINPVVILSVPSTQNNSTGTNILNKSLFIYNVTTKLLYGNLSVTIPNSIDGNLLTEFSVNIATPTGTSFTNQNVFLDTTWGYSYNSTSGNTNLSYISPYQPVISGDSIILDVKYQPNNISDPHTLNISFIALST